MRAPKVPATRTPKVIFGTRWSPSMADLSNLNGLVVDPMVVLTRDIVEGMLIRHLPLQAPLGGSMAEPQQEKRGARRFALRVPVTVNRNHGGKNEAAQIRDVSARGICFFLDSAVEQGAPIGFTLTLPPEITLTESIRVQCKGRVVRVEDVADDGKITVAAVIDEYEFLPEA
jgi:hypothetical protein